MDVQELNKQYGAKITEAKALAGGEVTEEVANKIDELLKQADEIKGRISLAERIQEGENFLAEPAGTKAAQLGWQQAEVIKDEADQPWERPGEFFKAVKQAAYYPAKEDPRLRAVKATGLSEGVPADGGYLVPPQFAAGIIDRVYGVGEILRRVSSDRVTGNSMTYNAIDETSRVIGSAYGGVRGYWMAEAATKTASKPAFRQMELKLKKVAALAYATDELLEDTTALESWLMRTVPEVLRYMVEEAIFNGTGAGQPLGIMNAGCLVSILRIDANEIDATDIANLWSRRWVGGRNYVWLVHQSVFPQLINLVVGNFPLLAISGIQGAPFATIYGRPVIETEYNQALGTTGDIILADLSQYQTITKGDLQSASSIHVAFTTDETAFRWVLRVDGQPLWEADLTPQHGSSDVGPFVCLTTASA